MYSIELSFIPLTKRDDYIASDAINSLLASFRMNGQIIGCEWSVTFNGKSYLAVVMTPEKNSLNKKFSNKYVTQRIKELTAKGLSKPKICVRGRELESPSKSKNANSRWFILFTNFLQLESPVRTGDHFYPVPLYKLPKTYDDEYNNIICWQSDYQSCDALQMGCLTGERFGKQEISDLNSSLTKRGLEICKQLSKLVHHPFYYYLYHGSGHSIASELNRPCPSCGNSKWRLKRPLHGIFDFKCDKCKLLSNIAWEFRNQR